MPRPSGQKRTYALVGAVFIALVLLHFIGWLQPFEQMVRSMLGPGLGKAHGLSIKIGDDYQFFKDKDAFISSYQACLLNSADLQNKNAQIALLQQENEQLRQQINFQKKTKLTLLVAEVIGKELGDVDQTVIINRGLDNGVHVGQPVTVDNGILVGKIIKVEKDISIARLINDNQSRIGTTVINNDHSLGVVEGGFGISLQMNMIPRNEVVQIGDTVITSGLEAGIPRGLVVGTVASVQNEAYQPFQTAVLTPGINLDKLTLVTIVAAE